MDDRHVTSDENKELVDAMRTVGKYFESLHGKEPAESPDMLFISREEMGLNVWMFEIYYGGVIEETAPDDPRQIN